ncbi:MAG: SDR family oxidoreductase [Halothermotrichaceae bacterium]
MIDKILITGATGNVGSEIIKLLEDKRCKITAAVRDITKAKKQLKHNIDYTRLDFLKQETYQNVLKNVNKIFLVRPPKIADVKQYIFPFIDIAKNIGVKQIVFLSLLGVEKNRFVPHYKIEKYIKNSGIPYTFLRASFFMQNLNTTHQYDIKENKEIFVPAGKGKTSFIDVRDIAEVGALALVEVGHQNKAYSLTGDKALNYYQVAEIFSRVLDRNIEYTKPSIFKFYRRMRKRGLESSYILVMIGLYTTARLGLAKITTDQVEKLLDRKPISLEKYVEDYQESFKNNCYMKFDENNFIEEY